MKAVKYLLLMFLCSNCAGSMVDDAYTQESYNNLLRVIASKNFEILVDRAEPRMTNALTQVLSNSVLIPGSTPSNIYLNGYNSLKIKGDSIKADLPFFGERFFGGKPGGISQNIAIENIPQKYIVKKNDKEHLVEIQFNINDKVHSNELYEVSITVYPNKTSVIFIQSSVRSLIKYSGELKIFENPME